PQLPAVSLFRKAVIPEITPQQAELPELVGDVFADVRDDAVRPDDDLFARFGIRVIFRPGTGFFDAHDPAAFQLAFGLKKDGALFLENLEGVGPELEPQDVALVGQEVVSDIEPRHRLQMSSHDAIDDEGTNHRGVGPAMFELVK